jgi:hypothetical protein
MDVEIACIVCNWSRDFWDWIAVGAAGAVAAAAAAAATAGYAPELPSGDEENANQTETDADGNLTPEARYRRGMRPFDFPEPGFWSRTIVGGAGRVQELAHDTVHFLDEHDLPGEILHDKSEHEDWSSGAAPPI